MVNPLKILLFLAGGTAVAGAGAYVSGALDPLLYPPAPAAIANLPAGSAEPTAAALPSEAAAPKEERLEEKPAAEQPAAAGQQPAETPATADASDQPPAAASGQPAAEGQKPADVAALDPQAPVAEPVPQPAAAAPAEQQPAAQQPAAGPLLPTFDLVRVEGDGSVVVAGKAAPNARIELLNGDTVIGASTAGPAGDFVVVFETQLAPGDYQITIRATNADGSTLSSAQTAIVSIPEKASGQVLAMIEEPGKPSEIITAPQPTAAASAAGSAEPKPDAAAPTAPADAPKPAEAAAAPADQAKPAEAEQRPAETADAPAQPEQPAAGTEVAAVDPKPAEPTTSNQPVTAAAEVAVEAVEIEGSKIFVAGRAVSGSTIRVYANEFMLGETRTSKAGRFLVEAKRELPVGSYIVRADMMGPDGVQVIARAAVPFEREPGENIAAVAEATPPAAQAPAMADAQQPAATPSPQPAASAEPVVPPAVVSTDKEDRPVQTATAEQPAADAPPATGEAQAPASGEQATQPAATAEAPAAAGQAQPAADAQPAASGEASPPAAAPAATQPADVAAATPDVTAPALKIVNSAVIIRRGDTLWRISKRVYGRGTRYSTIYLANQDQIRDPDMIWPGQVFGVPDKSKEGEAADMSKMGEQATSKAQ